MHGVLPLDVACGAKVLLELFELRHDVSVVSLKDEFGEKDVPLRKNGIGDYGAMFYQRGVETLQDIWIGFECE